MWRKKKPEPDDKEQSNRFMEIARQIDMDIDKKAFKDTCPKIFNAEKPIKEKRSDAESTASLHVTSIYRS
jgi:hypothetical protein